MISLTPEQSDAIASFNPSEAKILDLEESRSTLAEMQEKLIAQQEKIAEFEQEIRAAEHAKKVQDTQNEVDDLQQKLNETQEKLKIEESELAEAQEELDAAQNKVDAEQMEVDKLQQEFDVTQTDLNSKQNELNELQGIQVESSDTIAPTDVAELGGVEIAAIAFSTALVVALIGGIIFAVYHKKEDDELEKMKINDIALNNANEKYQEEINNNEDPADALSNAVRYGMSKSELSESELSKSELGAEYNKEEPFFPEVFNKITIGNLTDNEEELSDQSSFTSSVSNSNKDLRIVR